MAKKRVDHSSTGQSAAFDNPFAALAGLKENLPEGDSVPDVQPTPTTTRAFAAKLVLRVERKGRGGKTVTVLDGLQGADSERKEWQQELKNKLGCGAKWEGDSLVLQGDQETRLRDWLQAKGAQQVVGGRR